MNPNNNSNPSESNYKKLTHLEIEVQRCNQKKSETITTYMLRLETCITEFKTALNLIVTDEIELIGRIAEADANALRQFITGVIPRISERLRHNRPKDLTEALSLAIEEESNKNMCEKEKQLLFQQSRPTCRTCGKIGHISTNCFRNINNNVRQNYNSEYKNNSQKKFCKHCEKLGHLIDDCFKKDPSKRENYLKDRKIKINVVSKNLNKPLWCVSTE
jgi:hypothetical protein